MIDDASYMKTLAFHHHSQLDGLAREGADLVAARAGFSREVDDYLRSSSVQDAAGLRRIYEQVMQDMDARTDLDALKAEHAERRRHRASVERAARRRRLSGGQWAGIAVAVLIAGLFFFPESDASKARKAAAAASLDAVGACQKRIAASLGIRAGDVGFTTPRAVDGGHQMLWPQHKARCEVRGGRVVELVVRGNQVI